MFHNIIGNYTLGEEVTIGLGTYNESTRQQDNRHFYGFLTVMKSINSDSGYELYLAPNIILNSVPLSANFHPSVRERFGYSEEEFTRDRGLATQTFVIERVPIPFTRVEPNIEPLWSYSIKPIGLTNELSGTFHSERIFNSGTDSIIVYEPGDIQSMAVIPTRDGQYTSNNLMLGIDYDVRAYNTISNNYYPVSSTDDPSAANNWFIQRFIPSEDNPDLLVLAEDNVTDEETYQGFLSINKELGQDIDTKPIFTFLPGRNQSMYNLANSCTTNVDNYLDEPLDAREVYRLSYVSLANPVCNRYGNLLPSPNCVLTTLPSTCRVSNILRVEGVCRDRSISACLEKDHNCTWDSQDNSFTCKTENDIVFNNFLPLFIIVTLLVIVVFVVGYLIYINRR